MRALLAAVAGLVAAVLVVTSSSISSAGRSSAAQRPAAAISESDHHCADLLVQTEVQLAVVPGVWNCLEPGVKALFKGAGDEALVTSAQFTGSALVGCDSWLCVYSLTLDATTAAKSGIDESTMTVWLDSRGLVAHAAIPKPVP